MEKMRTVYLDELPERCRQEIRRFFRIPQKRLTQEMNVLYRDPAEYVILASKERNGTNYSKWQTSFLKKTDIQLFKEHNPNYNTRFYLIREDIQKK